MVFFGAALDIGVAIFFVAALAEYAKIRSKIEKPFGFLAAGGVLFILDGAWSTLNIPGFAFAGTLSQIFNIVGVLLVLVGSLLSVYKLVADK